MEGLNNIGEEVTPDNGHQGSQFMYLQARTDGGLPLVPTLFTREVIAGMWKCKEKLWLSRMSPHWGSTC